VVAGTVFVFSYFTVKVNNLFAAGAVDILDQVMGWFTVKGKSRRWTMTVLYYQLDATRQ
jgi:hypothetical protein